MYVQFLNGYDTGYSPINRYNASYFPVTFLEEQLARVDNAFEIVKQSGYTEDEQRVYIDRLRQLRLVPAYMYLHNFSLYYPDKVYEEKALAKEFFDECEDLGVRYYRESRLLSVLKAQYGL